MQKKSLFSKDPTRKSRESNPAHNSDAFSTGIARLSCRICNHFTIDGRLIYSECTKTIQIGPKKSFINDITFGQDVVYNITIVKKVFLLFNIKEAGSVESRLLCVTLQSHHYFLESVYQKSYAYIFHVSFRQSRIVLFLRPQVMSANSPLNRLPSSRL